ncbi:hypothetical protein [Mesomycoplasma neurolyticum]|uniref:DNA polymerase III subunit delta n=1 Tax=Mesomycoplasma neurolyticum TaxID=2120 RepID=A0A449A567_9BACT|nr:hypothetical protein [Mesomycoplasma neurolyticum]VEU59377.1 DNA polymerase III subunit delta [Mesomycoplasma neurolyticum]
MLLSTSKQIIFKAFQTKQFFHSWILHSENKNNINENLMFLISQILNKEIKNLSEIQNYCYILDGENNDFNKKKVEMIVKSLTLSTSKNQPKIFILLNLDKMHISILNSLLKFIEEPFLNTFIIMTTENIKSILKTILSRSIIIKCFSDDINKLKIYIDNNLKIQEKNLFFYLFESVDEIEKFGIDNANQILNEFLTLIQKVEISNLLFFLSKEINEKNIWFVLKLFEAFLKEKLFKNKKYFSLNIFKAIQKHKYLDQGKIIKILNLIKEIKKSFKYNVNFWIQKSYFISYLNDLLNKDGKK